MAQTGDGGEPTMEEILASIRVATGLERLEEEPTIFIYADITFEVGKKVQDVHYLGFPVDGSGRVDGRANMQALTVSGIVHRISPSLSDPNDPGETWIYVKRYPDDIIVSFAAKNIQQSEAETE